MKGLIIKRHWVNLILDGLKIWEIRGHNTKIRGKIFLIESGTKTVVGEVELVDSIPVDSILYMGSEKYHHIPNTSTKLPYNKTYAWVMQNPKRYEHPIPYNHPLGAVIWVELEDIYENTTEEVLRD